METPPLKRDYKDTLNLPKTDFPMRANLPEREPLRIEWWQQEKIHETVLAKNAGRPKFVLHDGPPYANGSIHFGHILNKVLKDIAVKYKNMAGFQAQFVPGWDCHGLPIEHQVDKDLKKQKKEFSVLEIRQACREYAAHFVSTQKKEFMRLGILGKWDHPYQTMNFSYEAATARELAKMVRKGLVYKSNTTIISPLASTLSFSLEKILVPLIPPWPEPVLTLLSGPPPLGPCPLT